ncbi:3-hydroxyacyl-CoA dehydrogenase family protein [Desulfitobacterium hafniense]|nr:3-hydroxyacyl-CoA dehydrogenase family protein [Desulfitobacterium hafniense]
MHIKRVTIIGANGTIGSKVAGMLTSLGRLTVYLVSSNIEKSMDAKNKAIRASRDDSIADMLIPLTYDELSDCVSSSQWVFEAIVEDIEAKLTINKLIARYRKPGTIVSTSTSGLSIEKLSSVFDEEGKALYFGTHFFNPPMKQLLCEMTPTSASNMSVFKDLAKFLENQLHRKAIFTADSPAFLANRIGFIFLNEAAQYADLYKSFGGIDYIDSILGPFTGRAIPPLDTIDFVGLDVHKAIMDNLAVYTNDIFQNETILPKYIIDLLRKEKFGYKSGCGLYKTEIAGDKKIQWVYDIESKRYRPKRLYNFEFAKKAVEALLRKDAQSAFNAILNSSEKEAEICRHFLIKYVVSSLVISQSVSNDLSSADIAMAYGFGWLPPLATLELLGGICGLKRLIRHDKMLNIEIDLEPIVANIPKCSLDYSGFLYAKL